MSKIFSKILLGKHELKNRVVRAATYEGCADAQGNPDVEKLTKMYQELADNDVALIITGFNYTSQEGRAMQPRQCGIDSKEKINSWAKIVNSTHEKGAKICMQISHVGRQSRSAITGSQLVSPSNIRCTYFNEKPISLTDEKIIEII